MQQKRTYRLKQTTGKHRPRKAAPSTPPPPARLKDIHFLWLQEYLVGVQESLDIRSTEATDAYLIRCEQGWISMRSGCTYHLLAHNPRNTPEWYHYMKEKMLEDDALAALSRSTGMKGVTNKDIQYGVYYISKHLPEQKESLMKTIFGSLVPWAACWVYKAKGLAPIGPTIESPVRDSNKLRRSVFEKDDPQFPMIRIQCQFPSERSTDENDEDLASRKTSTIKEIGCLTLGEIGQYIQQDLKEYIHSREYTSQMPPLDPKWTEIYMRAIDFFTYGFKGDALLWDKTTALIDEVAPSLPFVLWDIIKTRLNTNETQAELFSSRGFFKKSYNLSRHDAGTFKEVVTAASVMVHGDTEEGRTLVDDKIAETYKPLILRMIRTYSMLTGAKIKTVDKNPENDSSNLEPNPSHAKAMPPASSRSAPATEVVASVPKRSTNKDSGARISTSQRTVTLTSIPDDLAIYGNRIRDTRGNIEPLVLKYRPNHKLPFNDPPSTLTAGGVTPASMKAHFNKRKCHGSFAQGHSNKRPRTLGDISNFGAAS